MQGEKVFENHVSFQKQESSFPLLRDFMEMEPGWVQGTTVFAEDTGLPFIQQTLKWGDQW